MTQKSTLNKYERLKSKKLIDELFREGDSLFIHPFRLLYKVIPTIDLSYTESPLLFSVTVPKKRFKAAPDRNLIKRRIRESYRLNKMALQLSLGQASVTTVLMFIYVSNELYDYADIDKAMKRILKKLQDATTT